jgi:hypothetical protein
MGKWLLFAVFVIQSQAQALSGAFAPGSKFYWKLEGAIGSMPQTFDVYDIDLDAAVSNPNAIAKLHSQNKSVICYFSAGTWENGRVPNRYAGISKSSIGKGMGGWDERWLDIRKQDVRQAQVKILKAAKAAGCDAVEPDNVDHYGNSTGFNISKSDSISYLHWLAGAAHDVGLAIALKNSGDIVQSGRMHEHFDFTINEQCYTYGECAPLRAFTNAGRAVYIVEYKTTHESDPYPIRNFERDCRNAKTNNFFFMVYRTQSVNGDIVALCR